MNWDKIKRKYPKAFELFKKSYQLREVVIGTTIVLFIENSADRLESIDKTIINEFVFINKIRETGKHKYRKAFKAINDSLENQERILNQLIRAASTAQGTLESFYSNFFGRDKITVNNLNITGIDISVPNLNVPKLQEGVTFIEFIEMFGLRDKYITLDSMSSNTSHNRQPNGLMKGTIENVNLKIH